jgi:hypothetical protein
MKRDIHRNAPPFASVRPMNWPSTGDPRRTSRFIASYPAYPRQNFFFSPTRTQWVRLALAMAARGAPAICLLLDGA